MAIHERPEAVLGREKLGDREADLMFCRRTQPVLVLHERTSRLTLAAELAGETAATLMAIFKRLAPELKGSTTFDQPRQEASGSSPETTEARRPRRGSAFARHGLLAPLAHWRQRHDHLVLRRPRTRCGPAAEGQRREHQRPSATTAAEAPRSRHPEPGRPPGYRPLAQSPRKCLGYLTPIYAYCEGLGKDIQIQFA